MKIPVTLSLIADQRTVMIGPEEHHVMDLWVKAAEDTGDAWTTLVSLWDDNIERFQALGKQLDDPLVIDAQLGYRRDRYRSDVFYKELKTTLVWPEESLTF